MGHFNCNKIFLHIPQYMCSTEGKAYKLVTWINYMTELYSCRTSKVYNIPNWSVKQLVYWNNHANWVFIFPCFLRTEHLILRWVKWKKNILQEMVRYFEIKKACVSYDPNILKYANLISIPHLFLFLSEWIRQQLSSMEFVLNFLLLVMLRSTFMTFSIISMLALHQELLKQGNKWTLHFICIDYWNDQGK